MLESVIFFNMFVFSGFREIAEIFVNSVEFVFALVDGVVAGIAASILAVRTGIALTVSSVAAAASSAVSAVAAAGTAVGGFVNDLWLQCQLYFYQGYLGDKVL